MKRPSLPERWGPAAGLYRRWEHFVGADWTAWRSRASEERWRVRTANNNFSIKQYKHKYRTGAVSAGGTNKGKKNTNINYLGKSCSSLVKRSHSPFNKKIVCFLKQSFKFILESIQAYCWIGKLSGKPVTPLYLKSFLYKCEYRKS